MFPQDQLIDMVRSTNLNIAAETGKTNDSTAPGYLLKWIGVLIMATNVEFGTRDSLWNT